MPSDGGDPPAPLTFVFGAALETRLRQHLAAHDRLAVPLDEHRHAAVALVVVDAGGEAGLLLTRRATGLRDHAGQWALPGGRVDDGEEPVAGARRELHEELGLELTPTDCLGLLDDYVTRSGFVITPVVFWAPDPLDLHPNPAEVASVHVIGFGELCRADSPRFITIAESERPVVQLPFGDFLIHAPTAAVVVQFRRVALEGVLERVGHYEQPLFAWR